MEVLLIKNVAKLGERGEVKEVSDGYARNFLFRRGLAVVASQQNINNLNKPVGGKEVGQKLSQAKIARLKQRLQGMNVKLARPANDKGHLFAKIQVKDLVIFFQDKNIDVKEENIIIPIIKEVGKHKIEVKLADEVNVTLTVEVIANNKS